MKLKNLFMLPLCALTFSCSAYAGQWNAVAPVDAKPKAHWNGLTGTVSNSNGPDMHDYKEGHYYYAYTRDFPGDAPGYMLAVYTFEHNEANVSATLNGGYYAEAGTNIYSDLGSSYSAQPYYNYAKTPFVAVDPDTPSGTDSTPASGQKFEYIAVTSINDLVSFEVSAYGNNGVYHAGDPGDNASVSVPEMTVEVTNVSLSNP